ncbi:hypothetical protein CRG98_043937 [Punica granatum]|uniref:Uncharacterized protein n=1 Tax=Punica granatum TaxID=22663 RepID=A0A2I0HWM3_PUNGR|nr:hypothetical protein CRG98_043937 [Punica granatum]
MEDSARNDVDRAELYVPGKDRVLFRPSGRKSLLGLDALAKSKREASSNTSGFKVPSIASTMEEEETPEPIVTGEEGSNGVKVARTANRRYRDVARKEDYYAESNITGGKYGASTPQSHRSSDGMHLGILTMRMMEIVDLEIDMVGTAGKDMEKNGNAINKVMVENIAINGADMMVNVRLLGMLLLLGIMSLLHQFLFEHLAHQLNLRVPDTVEGHIN